jgi:hypothetical protein
MHCRDGQLCISAMNKIRSVLTMAKNDKIKVDEKEQKAQ